MAGFDMNFFSAGKALTAGTSGLQLNVSMKDKTCHVFLFVFLVVCIILFLDVFLNVFFFSRYLVPLFKLSR